MIPAEHPSLSHLDFTLLRIGERLVPRSERGEWARAWQAELWYMHARATRPGQRQSLAVGLIRDALWLRTDSWRIALSGTALLCLTLLTTLVGIAALPAFVSAGSWKTFAHLLVSALPRFAIASSLILFVRYANGTGNVHGSGSVLRRFRARAFFAAKISLVLLLTFVSSIDLSLPLEAHRFFVAMPVQLLFFVILALLGLRWSSLDSERRCKHCLRSLAAPARVGRPSWNFLEYNGTESVCRDGHGVLTVPELETSWCRSSAWIPQRLP